MVAFYLHKNDDPRASRTGPIVLRGRESHVLLIAAAKNEERNKRSPQQKLTKRVHNRTHKLRFAGNYLVNRVDRVPSVPLADSFNLSLATTTT